MATALLREHPEWGISRIIATAVNWAKKVCATGKAFGGRVKVSKLVKAAACKAVASWEAKKAKASSELIDDEIITASEADSISHVNALMRKVYRKEGRDIIEPIILSDEEYFAYAIDEPITLSDQLGEEDDYVEDIEAFMQVVNLSAAAQSAIRLPLHMSEATKVEGGKYKKEILRVGEIVVDRFGRKFNFTSQFLKDMKKNFDKRPLDYVPLLYTKDGEVHASSSDPNKYGGYIEDIELDNPDNPTKAYGMFNLTEDTAKVVEHNPKFGVSVTAHPNYVDGPRGVYYGPTLLDVAATHKPKLTRMGDWSKVSVMASNEQEEFSVIDLSDSTFVEETEKKEEIPMAEKELNNNVVELSDEQRQELFSEFMKSDMFQSALSTAVKDKDAEIARLSSSMDEIQRDSYETLVKSAINTYRDKDGKGVPPIMLSMAEELLLSFTPEERNTTIELSMGEGENATTETVNRVQLVTKMLEESKNFLDLGKEAGSQAEPVELSDKSVDDAANFLAGMVRNEV